MRKEKPEKILAALWWTNYVPTINRYFCAFVLFSRVVWG